MKPKTPTVVIKLKDLTPMYASREVDPNKLDDERLAGLKALMQLRGALQPLLVNKMPKGYLIIDGHHRFWMAQELGWSELICVVISVPETEARALSLAMNRLRGELDMTLSAEVIRDVLIESGWDTSNLSINTGFTVEEVEALVNQAKTFEETELGDVGTDVPPDEAPRDKPFILEVSFATKDQLRLVRRKLKKAAGKSRDLGIGLLQVLGEEIE